MRLILKDEDENTRAIIALPEGEMTECKLFGNVTMMLRNIGIAYRDAACDPKYAHMLDPVIIMPPTEEDL